MSDDAQRELREVQAFFRLPSVGLVEKDLHVVRAIAALAAIDAAPFRLVFGGGTALARAHHIIRRMSEDVDFKIVPLPRRRSAAVRCAGSSITCANRSRRRCRRPASLSIRPTNRWPGRATKNRYTVWQLPYASESGAGEGLRPPSRSS